MNCTVGRQRTTLEIPAPLMDEFRNVVAQAILNPGTLLGQLGAHEVRAPRLNAESLSRAERAALRFLQGLGPLSFGATNIRRVSWLKLEHDEVREICADYLREQQEAERQDELEEWT